MDRYFPMLVECLCLPWRGAGFWGPEQMERQEGSYVFSFYSLFFCQLLVSLAIATSKLYLVVSTNDTIYFSDSKIFSSLDGLSGLSFPGVFSRAIHQLYFSGFYWWVAKFCPTLCDPVDCSQPGFSIHGISQVRILAWVATSFSRGSSWPKDWTHVSCIGRWILYHWATRKVNHFSCSCLLILKLHLPSYALTPFASFSSLLVSPAHREIGIAECC